MHRSSEDYLLPYSALLYAQELKRQGYDILFVFDEFQVHHLKEIMLFNTAKVPVVRISNKLSILIATNRHRITSSMSYSKRVDTLKEAL